MADRLNILTPTPAPTGGILRLRTPHQAALVELAHLLGWPTVDHRRQSGFTVHIPPDEAAWVRFAVDGRRKDQFAVLAWLAARAHEQETEALRELPPTPYLQVARPQEPVAAVAHHYTRADGTLN